jgi:hypothetical protein
MWKWGRVGVTEHKAKVTHFNWVRGEIQLSDDHIEVKGWVTDTVIKQGRGSDMYLPINVVKSIEFD